MLKPIYVYISYFIFIYKFYISFHISLLFIYSFISITFDCNEIETWDGCRNAISMKYKAILVQPLKPGSSMCNIALLEPLLDILF